MSLQLGSELFDISQQVEGVSSNSSKSQSNRPATSLELDSMSQNLSQTQDGQFTGGLASGSHPSGSQSQPSTSNAISNETPLTYLVVPYAREGVLQTERPISATLSFRPTNLKSETHKKLAQAVKHHKTTRVAAAEAEGADPEAQAEKREKELKDKERKRKLATRKQAIADGLINEDEELDLGSRRRGAGRFQAATTPAGKKKNRRTDYESDEEEEEEMSDDSDRRERGAKGKSDRKTRDKGDDEVLDGFIIDDGSDEEDAKSKSKKKFNRDFSDDSESGEDDIDIAEKRIVSKIDPDDASHGVNSKNLSAPKEGSEEKIV